jgi:hypothetical protein
MVLFAVLNPVVIFTFMEVLLVNCTTESRPFGAFPVKKIKIWSKVLINFRYVFYGNPLIGRLVELLFSN